MIPKHLIFSEKPRPACEPGAFLFAAVGLEHGHIDPLCWGFSEAGATLFKVYDPDPEKVAKFCRDHPGVKPTASLGEILDDPQIQLVAGAAIPVDRASLGCQVMRAGKHYCTVKAPFVALEQWAEARKVSQETGRRYFVYFNERVQVESALYATQVIERGLIGKVINYVGLGPHRLNAANRPAWFFDKTRGGGILGDIGIHHIEQFLHFTGAQKISLTGSRVGNFTCPTYPDFEDFGEASFVADQAGATGYCRVDWLTPNGLRTWGDGRVTILGTKGYIELRKYVDAGRSGDLENVLLVTDAGEDLFSVKGEIGFPFFGEVIQDCLEGTERAMTQDYIFEVSRLALESQKQAIRVTS